ncbi:MAG: hypothetical protein RLZZ46_914 [Bacteroidota bacterium]|jgi:polysaccharide export outer membrane protein
MVTRIKSHLSFVCILSVVFFAMTLESCVSKKSSVYFQSESTSSLPAYEPILQVNDFISIYVSAQNQELSDLFNPFSKKSSESGSTSSSGSNGAGYIIDSKGCIEFPLIGSVKIAGLTTNEAVQMLKERLKLYIKDPMVVLTIENYHITILGDVKNPGTFRIPSARVTFAEALGMAGDLNITALRENILLIRTQNGQKKTFRIDITKQDIFSSPEYCFLRQGDVIYVEPNRAQRNSGAVNNKLGIILSIMTVVLTSITLISR